MSSVRGRLARLERHLAPGRPPLDVAFVDEHGLILDGRSEAVRPWVGRRRRELPGAVSVVVGVDPLVVLGHKRPSDA
jgi:hypothetical protein